MPEAQLENERGENSRNRSSRLELEEDVTQTVCIQPRCWTSLAYSISSPIYSSPL